jgi:hypothetical protein
MRKVLSILATILGLASPQPAQRTGRWRFS